MPKLNEHMLHQPRRPHASSKVIDLGNSVHLADVLDTICWDYSSDRFQKILIVASSIPESDFLSRILEEKYPGEVFSAARLQKRQLNSIPATARITVTISVVCELGISFEGYSSLYILTAPSCSSTFPIYGNLVTTALLEGRLPRVRVFSCGTPESQINARWIEAHMGTYSRVLHTEISRVSRFVPRRLPNDTVGMFILDDTYNLYAGAVFGPCTAGSVEELSVIHERWDFCKEYKASTSDMFPVQKAVYQMLEDRERPVIVCRTPDALLKGTNDYMSAASRLRILRYAARAACKTSLHIFPYLRDAVNQLTQESK